jgi:hypothetical protein
MNRTQTPQPHGLRAATRKAFAVALTVISAVAAFAIAGEATPPRHAALHGAQYELDAN